jgi:transposase-like protein
MAAKLAVRDFFQRFSDDEACLTHIMTVRFGMRHACRACGQDATFHRLEKRRAYACARCGDNLYPTAGTVFEDTRTPLQLWFYAIYLFVVTRHGVSAKALQRQLGVTYKTAWRMGHKIRELIASTKNFDLLSGHIEVDEAYVGGKRPGKRGRGAEGKTVVVGMKEGGGSIEAKVVPNVKKSTLRAVINERVEKGSIVSTDELRSYGLLDGDGYKHGTVRHAPKEWAHFDAEHDALHHTNNVEGFWRLFKNSIRSTHIHVSEKHMAKYLDEFAFRSNHRAMENAMFDLLIGAV